MNRVIKSNQIGLTPINKVSENKVYAFKGDNTIYKLHRISPHPKYAFISLDNSICYGNGIFNTFREAFKYTITSNKDIYEFDNTVEFLEWAVKESKGELE